MLTVVVLQPFNATPTGIPATAILMDTIPYALDEPTNKFVLPKALREISGLSHFDDQQVAAIQDERGILYLLNAQTGEITREIKFAGGGDYEGVEVAGDFLFVLRSDGDLFVFSADETTWLDRERARRIRTRLSSRCDAEGLALDRQRNHLLIACKEYPGRKMGKTRAVYSFDLETETVAPEPLLLLSAKLIREADKDSDVKYSRFKPSALSVHPFTGQLYLISSPDRRLIVLDDDGTVTATALLNKNLRQPEGLTFLENGDLVIASEAAGKRPVLYTYAYQNSTDVE